jgi:hypothetical protein
MSKEFKAYDKKYSSLRDSIPHVERTQLDTTVIKQVEKWPFTIRTYTHEQIAKAVYDSPGSEEWQQFRVSLKGQSTHLKIFRLIVRRHIKASEPDYWLEKIRIDNYIGALVRGGQLNSDLEIVR